jgi:hypothetical protein
MRPPGFQFQPTQQPDVPERLSTQRLSPLDNWEHLRDALPPNGGDYRYPPGSAGQLYGSIRSPHEVRQPAWAREEGEPRGYYPGTSSKFANMHSRREARRHFEANDDCRHQSYFAAAQPPRRSVPIQPHYVPAQRLGGSRIQPRPLHLKAPKAGRLTTLPFHPSRQIPCLLGTVTLVHFGRHQVGTGYASYGGYRGRDDDDLSDDEGYSSEEDWL